MPTYEYKCTSCGKEFEYQQRMSEAPKDLCEACGGKLERLISRTAFQLKGGGWYKDLYSSSKPESGGASGGGDGKAKPAADAAKPASDSPAPASSTPAPSGGGSSSGSGSGGDGGGGGGTKTGGGSSAAASK